MRLPGFMAEASFSAAGVASNARLPSNPGSSRGIISALPLGGYACLALAEFCASGRKGAKEACSALSACRKGDGYPECTVTPGGGCIAWNCSLTSCWCVAYGPPGPTVTCSYGTTGW